MAGGAANLAGLHDLLMLQAPANGSIAGPLLQQWPQQQQQHGDPSGRQQLPGLAALHPQPMHGAPATHVGSQQQQQISQQGLLQALAASGHSGLMHRLSQRSWHGLQAPDLAAVQTLLMPGGPVVHGHAPTNGHAGESVRETKDVKPPWPPWPEPLKVSCSCLPSFLCRPVSVSTN